MLTAEQAVIGAFLIDPGKIREYSGTLTPEMFGQDILGRAWYELGRMDPEKIVPAELTMRLREFYPMIAESVVIDCVRSGSVVELRGNVDVLRKEYLARKVKETLDHVIVSGATVEQTAVDLAREITALVGTGAQAGESIDGLAERLRDDFFCEHTGRKIDIGFPEVDRAMGGIEGGDLVLIAARPAVGKSALALQVVKKLSGDGLKVAYINLEMRERQVLERLIASSGGLELNRIRRGVRFLNDEKERFERAIEDIQKMRNVFVYSGVFGVSDIRKAAAGFDVVVVDYLQLIKPDGRRTGNRYAEVGDISHGLKAIAMDFNIPVIALSQLNRASVGGKEPTMSELRESGDLEQDASVILILWEPDENDPRRRVLKVEKARQGFTHREELSFDGAHMTFSEWQEAENDPFA